MCEDIYIGSTQQKSKKILYGHFSDLLHLLKSGQTSDSFAAHSEQHFDYTTSCTDLRKCMDFKVVNMLNPIVAIKKIRNITVTYVWRNV